MWPLSLSSARLGPILPWAMLAAIYVQREQAVQMEAFLSPVSGGNTAQKEVNQTMSNILPSVLSYLCPSSLLFTSSCSFLLCL